MKSALESRRTIAAAIVGGAAVLFAVLNVDEVEVNWIIGTWETPLIVVIVLSLAIGAALGWFSARRRAGRGARNER